MVARREVSWTKSRSNPRARSKATKGDPFGQDDAIEFLARAYDAVCESEVGSVACSCS